jgi:uncharacterized protein (DUF1697 family)
MIVLARPHEAPPAPSSLWNTTKSYYLYANILFFFYEWNTLQVANKQFIEICSSQAGDNFMATRYVALLKGVNMIGKNTIKMDQLIDIFTKMGFLAVRTVGGSGNILFDTEQQELLPLTWQIETKLAEATGRKSTVFLRTQAAFQEMAEANPFRDLNETNIKRRVAFLSAPLSSEHLLIPYAAEKDLFKLIAMGKQEVYCVGYPNPIDPRRFGNPATFLEKTFSIEVTVREWSVVGKIASSA